MTAVVDRLRETLADRYRIERFVVEIKTNAVERKPR
jgi:hypothetical protein